MVSVSDGFGLNPSYEAKDDFSRFSQFPAELRRLVWEHALGHERFIQVALRPGPTVTRNGIYHTRAARYTGVNSSVDESGFQETYSVVLSGCQAISKLFRVNSESRRTALRFYRVHIPCRYYGTDWVEKNGTFYFHPELDTIEVAGQEYFLDFAQFLWENDREHIGLVNLTINTGYIEKNVGPIFNHIPRLVTPHMQAGDEPDNIPLLLQVLPRLRRVIFTYTGYAHGFFLNPILVPMIYSYVRAYRTGDFGAPVTCFKRLQYDPRSTNMDLKRNYVGSRDPRVAIYRWLKQVAKWGVQYDHEVDYRFKIPYEGYEMPKGGAFPFFERYRKDLAARTNRRDPNDWQWEKREGWSAHIKDLDAMGIQIAGETPPPPIGFWLFPIEALGSLPDINDDQIRLDNPPDRYIGMIDLSNCKPELCLFHTPTDQHSGATETSLEQP